MNLSVAVGVWRKQSAKYRIPDFSNRKNPAAFDRAFARLEKDLRTSLR
jgi:hypothetical protein